MIQTAASSSAPHILSFPTLATETTPLDTAAMITLRSFYESVLLPEIKPQQSANSLKEDRIALNHWERVMGAVDIRDIDRGQVQRFRDGLVASKLSDATVNKTWRELKAILESAYEEELIDRVPTVARKMKSKLIRKEKTKRQREVLTMADVEQLWQACRFATYPAEHVYLSPAPKLWRVALVLFWVYGVRTQDLLSLKWCDVEFKSRTIRFEAVKTGKLQGLPLTDCVEAHLRSIHRPNAVRVFPGFNSRGCFLKRKQKWKPGYYASWNGEIVANAGLSQPVQFKNFRQRVVNDYNAAFPSIKLGSWIAGHSLPGVSAMNYELPTREIREAIAAADVPDCFAQIG